MIKSDHQPDSSITPYGYTADGKPAIIQLKDGSEIETTIHDVLTINSEHSLLDESFIKEWVEDSEEDFYPYHYPLGFKLGGVQWVTEEKNNFNDSEQVGVCEHQKCKIGIRHKTASGDTVPPSARLNTFHHELVHAMLVNMGESELSKDESFVQTFANMLTEYKTTAHYSGA